MARLQHGQGHPRTLASSHRLAHVLHAQGKEDEALAARAEALAR